MQWKRKCWSLSRVWFSVTPWTVAHRLLCPWDLPVKNTGVGCRFLLQGIFPTQGSNPCLLRHLHGMRALSHHALRWVTVFHCNPVRILICSALHLNIPTFILFFTWPLASLDLCLIIFKGPVYVIAGSFESPILSVQRCEVKVTQWLSFVPWP